MFEEYFLACEGEVVRGGYILKRQLFWDGRTTAEAGCVYLPLSEGAVDKQFSQIALQMLRNALKTQPRLFSLGMGGFHNPYPRLLKAAGWSLCTVPFYFRIVSPVAFLKNFTMARRAPAARILMDALAVTGIGWLGIKCLQHLFAGRSTPPEGHVLELVSNFEEWTDQLWEQGRNQYKLTAVRDAATLNRLYPPTKKKYLRLKVSKDGVPIGWAVMLATRFPAHKQFGNMRIGSVIDCFAASGSETVVAQAATQLLEQHGADIIATNQSHRSWCSAFARAGHWRGPSNFIFAGSPRLIKDITPFNELKTSMHFTRGDGEGPSHL